MAQPSGEGSGPTLSRHLAVWPRRGVLARAHALLVGHAARQPPLIVDSCSLRAKRVVEA